MILKDECYHLIGACAEREHEGEERETYKVSVCVCEHKPTQFSAEESSLSVSRDGPNTTPKFTKVILFT